MKLINSIVAIGLTVIGFTQQAAAAEEKDFVWYCESDEATPAQKETVREIYFAAKLDPKKVQCQQAFDIMQNKPSLGFWFDSVLLTDLSPLSGLTNISFLSCDGCNTEAVESIPKLPELEFLDLKGGGLTKVPDLTRFPKLWDLTLSHNEISEVIVSDRMKNISTLNLTSTKIADFSFFAEMKSLTRLTLIAPSEVSLETIPILPNLRSLRASSIPTNNYSFLKKAPNVTNLSLFENDIKDLSSIFLADSITHLDIASNSIENVTADMLPKGLKHLALGDNPVKSYESLVKLEKLESLDLSYSFFNEWQAIDFLLSKLSTLNLSSTETSHIEIEKSDFKNWPKMKKIYLDQTHIESLAFFKDVKAPKLSRVTFPKIENKTEENCPTSGVPAPVAKFCKDK